MAGKKGQIAWNKGVPDSGFKKGYIPWNKGLKEPAIIGIKISQKLKKYYSEHQRSISQEVRMKISNTLKGNKCALGHKLSEETKRIISEKGRGRIAWNKGKTHLVGDKNPAWQGGKSFEPYSVQWSKKLRDEIRRRDSYACRECGYTQGQLGYIFPVHHIDYNKKNCAVDNLITLCNSCHSQTNFSRSDWEKYYRSKLTKCL